MTFNTPAKAALLGLVALLLLLIGAFLAPAPALQGYYVAWLFWITLSLGSLLMTLLIKVIPSRWGKAIGGSATAAALALPWMALLVIPVFFFLPEIFPWAQPGYFATHDWPHKSGYLQPHWFILRSVVYLAAGASLALLVAAPRVTHKGLAAVGLVFYALMMIFAGTDWVASLATGWFSSMFPVIFMATQFLSALALLILLCPSSDPDVLHDLGNLLLAFVVFWTYVSFSQFLIIWSGNLPQEIGWYVWRRTAGWPATIVVIVLLQFALPFALLLSRAAKRQRQRLKPIAATVLGATVINLYWLTAPTFHSALPHWQEMLAFVGIGELWTACFLRALARAGGSLAAQKPESFDG